ncbi:6546_t:CDS:2, partial [Funneliformis caledonium]
FELRRLFLRPKSSSKSYDNDDDYDLSDYNSGSLSKQMSSQDSIPISSSKSKSDDNYGLG